jgi:hypothetical protein
MNEHMNDLIKKYHKYKNYICEIEIFENINESINFDKLYKTSRCKINKIINIVDNTELDKIDEIYYRGAIIEKIREINLYDTIINIPNIIYFYSYYRCFYFNFIEDKQYLLFNNFCGICKIYSDSGYHIKSILINNNDIIQIN